MTPDEALKHTSAAAQEALRANPFNYEPATRPEGCLAMDTPLWRMSHIYKILVKGEEDSEEDAGLIQTFTPNDAQRILFLSFWYRNIILKARQLGFCLDPATPVLTADLRWVAIGELKAGQEVVAVDEFPPGGRGQSRKMRTASVEAVVTVRRHAYRITLDDGRQVVCTDQHPWLTRKASTEAGWRSISGKGNRVIGRIKPGTKIRWITQPWGESDYDDGWMGGMLDGEGSMAKSNVAASINVSQVEGPCLGRMEHYLHQRGYHYRTETDEGERESKYGATPVHKLVVGRMDEMFRLIGQARPSRFLGNRFWEGRELPGKRNGGMGWATVTSIEYVGEQDMIDLQTSTGTYIAEGLVSHNTTAITILFLDSCLFRANVRAGMIAQTDPIAKKLFRDKVKFAYDNLPWDLRTVMPLERESAEELMFAHNGSSIQVSTSMRSGTLQYLHVSEFGKICAEFPKRAHEVVTGSIPTVPSNGVVFIESTAQGREGQFYSMTKRAEDLHKSGRKLSRKDYKFHFFPWWKEPRYRLAPEGVRITPEDGAYFDSIEASQGIKVDLFQRAWYVSTRDGDFSGDEEIMYQEYPSTPAEAFHQSTKGTYFAAQFTAARKQGRLLQTLPVVPSIPCYTCWDIGNSDGTAIWVVQKVGHEWRLIDFYEEWGEPYSHAVQWLQSRGLVWDTMFLPHDADHQRQGQLNNKSPKEMLEELMPGTYFEIVDRVEDINWGIQQLRDFFPLLWFDETKCKEGIEHLELYRRKWNTNQQTYMDQPDKTGGHSEAADALRQLAQAYTNNQINITRQTTRRSRGSWRTA